MSAASQSANEPAATVERDALGATGTGSGEAAVPVASQSSGALLMDECLALEKQQL